MWGWWVLQLVGRVMGAGGCCFLVKKISWHNQIMPPLRCTPAAVDAQRTQACRRRGRARLAHVSPHHAAGAGRLTAAAGRQQR